MFETHASINFFFVGVTISRSIRGTFQDTKHNFTLHLFMRLMFHSHVMLHDPAHTHTYAEVSLQITIISEDFL